MTLELDSLVNRSADWTSVCRDIPMLLMTR